jgi:hypothetical protein
MTAGTKVEWAIQTQKLSLYTLPPDALPQGEGGYLNLFDSFEEVGNEQETVNRFQT